MKLKQLYLLTILLLCGTFILHAQNGNVTLGDNAAPGLNTGSNTGSFNTILGNDAGFNLTNASENTFIGHQAGFNNTTNENVFIGAFSGFSNTTGSDNVFIGFRAGYTTTNRSDNVFIGTRAGENSTGGDDNVFVGYVAGEDNTTGDDNVFLGYFTGRENTTGSDNVFIGRSAGSSSTTGGGNTFVGARTVANFDPFNDSSLPVTTFTEAAGQINDTGSGNTFFGAGAGSINSDADGNTMIGYAAGANNRASKNTFVGYGAGLESNGRSEDGTGEGNTFFGFYSGANNKRGANNVVLGSRADFSTTGDYNNNILIGNRTILDGDNSISIGIINNVVGDYTICLGNFNEISGDNSVVIGRGIDLNTNNTIYIGGAFSTSSVRGYVNWTAISDARFKSDVKENVVGLDFINRLRPVTYNFDVAELRKFKKQIFHEREERAMPQEQIQYSGFIAQEVEAAAKASNYDFSGVDKPDHEEDIYGLRYAEFVVPLVKAVQELSSDSKEKEERIKQLLANEEKEDIATTVDTKELEQVGKRLKNLETRLKFLNVTKQ